MIHIVYLMDSITNGSTRLLVLSWHGTQWVRRCPGLCFSNFNYSLEFTIFFSFFLFSFFIHKEFQWINLEASITMQDSEIAYLFWFAGQWGIRCRCRRNIASIAWNVGLFDALKCKHSPIIFHKSLGIPTPTTLEYCGGGLPSLTTAR